MPGALSKEPLSAAERGHIQAVKRAVGSLRGFAAAEAAVAAAVARGAPEKFSPSRAGRVEEDGPREALGHLGAQDQHRPAGRCGGGQETEEGGTQWRSQGVHQGEGGDASEVSFTNRREPEAVQIKESLRLSNYTSGKLETTTC